MKTEIRKTGDMIVVSMNGRLDFETSVPLREDLGKLLRQARTDTSPKKIIVSFENLEFVGSSGISSFVQALKDFNANSPVKPRYCNVGSEFRRVIRAFDEDQPFDFYDNEERARRSFDQNN